MTSAAADPRIADIIENGSIRLALFLPQYAKTPSGDINPVAAGLVAHEMIGALAKSLGIALELVEQPTPPQAIETLNAGGCDVMILGIDGDRGERVDFTPPVIQFDYAYLVHADSPIVEAAEVDRPGRRIAVVEGHASWMALKRVIENAEIVGLHLPDEAFAQFRDGKSEVFALPREQLIDYAEKLPGARILTRGFGVNDVGLAVAKGRTDRLAFFSEFAEEAKASGLVGRILDGAGLTSRGFNVAG